MMGTAKPKSKKSASEPIQIEPVIETEINKNNSKKSSTVKLDEVVETREMVETAQDEIKDSFKKSKIAKTKVIRDSFSFPEKDYLKISELKKTCLAEGIHVKKGEILRAGLHLLSKLNLAELKQVIDQVERVQTGRPNATKI